MKKTPLFFSICAIVLPACKKEYTCECFNPGGVFETHELYDTKGNAEDRCQEYAASYQYPWSETGCRLK